MEKILRWKRLRHLYDIDLLGPSDYHHRSQTEAMMFSLKRFLDVRDEDAGLLYRAYYAFFFSGMMANVLGSILPSIISEHSLSFSFQGTLLSINQIGNLLAVWLSGFLPYAIGRRRSTVIMGSGIVLGFLLMVFTGNPCVLLVAFVFLGVGRGTMSNITNVVVGQYAGNRATGLNLLHAAFAVGAFIGPFLVVICGDEKWRIPALIIACGMASALTLFHFSRLPVTREKKAEDDSSIPSSFSFWLNTMILFCYLCGESTFMGWLVTYLKNQGIFPSALANAMSSLLWIMILLSRLMAAALSTKVKKEKLILALGSSMFLFTFLLVNTADSVTAAVAVLGIGLSMGGIYPTVISTNEKRYVESTIATGICIATATVGSVVMPSVVGWIADSMSMDAALKSILLPLFVMVILMAVKLARSAGRSAAR